ncbi:MAG: RNB domain-containing ribonuclease, partial [Candidatus Dadabacteria bacterium]|nr:RNB domain-containing ribonuclease [Candidatus Dadabacteria bacterium]
LDGRDAKDFDDAVYCELRENGWRLWVAIADVSHYVQLGSALDHEARKRGTSVYFPERVIPMLPKNLSNELCSLKPNV